MLDSMSGKEFSLRPERAWTKFLLVNPSILTQPKRNSVLVRTQWTHSSSASSRQDEATSSFREPWLSHRYVWHPASVSCDLHLYLFCPWLFSLRMGWCRSRHNWWGKLVEEELARLPWSGNNCCGSLSLWRVKNKGGQEEAVPITFPLPLQKWWLSQVLGSFLICNASLQDQYMTRLLELVQKYVCQQYLLEML